MRPNITITIPTPYLPLKEYCRLTGTPVQTAEKAGQTRSKYQKIIA